MDPKRELLRHTLATIAYRGGKAVRNAPPSFATFKASPSSRTPGEILAHIGDLMDWALSIAKGAQTWRDSPAGMWDPQVTRFFESLAGFDAFLAGDVTPAVSCERLFQGPVADALTHIGQLAMLRRMAGAAIRGENYYKADVAAGRIGLEQSPPRQEFD